MDRSRKSACKAKIHVGRKYKNMKETQKKNKERKKKQMYRKNRN